ncbi:MAG: hypothetical protein ABSG03_40240 [Bryobacteraceae bacterium]|jgi:hypothetical protein
MKAKRAVYVVMSFLLANACSVGPRHTSDSKLEQRFFQHQAEFDTLLADVQADEKLTMIGPHEICYAGRTLSVPSDLSEIERLGLTAQRWADYQRQLRELGLALVTKSDGGVEFRVDIGSFLNGDSYKGYEYNSHPAEHPKASLDGYRTSENDRQGSGGYYVSKPLQGSWRLYLYVNG